MSASQSWETWKGIEPTDVQPASVATSGTVVMAEVVPMDENHPFYAEWQQHVESQNHQGC